MVFNDRHEIRRSSCLALEREEDECESKAGNEGET